MKKAHQFQCLVADCVITTGTGVSMYDHLKIVHQIMHFDDRHDEVPFDPDVRLTKRDVEVQNQLLQACKNTLSEKKLTSLGIHDLNALIEMGKLKLASMKDE